MTHSGLSASLFSFSLSVLRWSLLLYSNVSSPKIVSASFNGEYSGTKSWRRHSSELSASHDPHQRGCVRACDSFPRNRGNTGDEEGGEILHNLKTDAGRNSQPCMNQEMHLPQGSD